VLVSVHIHVHVVPTSTFTRENMLSKLRFRHVCNQKKKKKKSEREEVIFVDNGIAAANACLCHFLPS
jgi:hypothetical protein